MIKKVKDKFVIYSESGTILGKFNSKTLAEDRLKQIEAFKHMRRK